MKRILRILRGSAIAVSLLLFAITLILWPRSYYVEDRLSQGGNGYASDRTLIRCIYVAASCKGDLLIARGQVSSLMFGSISPKEEGIHLTHERPPSSDSSGPPARWRHLGFSYTVLKNPMVEIKAIGVPYWFLTASSLLLPAFWLFVRLRQKNAGSNLCRTCGYDMRATPERCPECGNPAVTMQT